MTTNHKYIALDERGRQYNITATTKVEAREIAHRMMAQVVKVERVFKTGKHTLPPW